MWPRSRGVAHLLLASSLLAGCPVSEGAKQRTADTCEQIGARCTSAEGPIGICNDSGRTDCERPPCLACMPQH